MSRIVSSMPWTPVIASSQKPRPQQHEHDFQKSAIEYLRLVLPATASCFSIDHANARSKVTGALRKARGVIPGIPDIYCSWSPDPAVRLGMTIWFECKRRRGGSLNRDQEHFRDNAIAQGQYWFEVRTLDEIDNGLRQTPVPLRRVTVF